MPMLITMLWTSLNIWHLKSHPFAARCGSKVTLAKLLISLLPPFCSCLSPEKKGSPFVSVSFPSFSFFHISYSLSLFLSSYLYLSLMGKMITVMLRISLWSTAQCRSRKWLAARYHHNRIKSALTVCQLNWEIQFVMICKQQCLEPVSIQTVRLQSTLKGVVRCCCLSANS